MVAIMIAGAGEGGVVVVSEWGLMYVGMCVGGDVNGWLFKMWTFEIKSSRNEKMRKMEEAE